MNDTSSEILVICDQNPRESYWLASLRAMHRGPIMMTAEMGAAITPILMRLPSSGGVIYDVQNTTEDHLRFSLRLIRKVKAGIRILVVGRAEDASRKEIVRQIGGHWIEDEFSSADSSPRSNATLGNWLNVKRSDQLTLLDDRNQFRTMSDLEAEVIDRALAHYSGNMYRASSALGISRSTLYRKMAALELRKPGSYRDEDPEDSPNDPSDADSRFERA